MGHPFREHKTTDITLNDVSLREARIKRDAARQEVRAGIDIVQAKRSARKEAQDLSEIVATPTFQECAERFIEENWSKWSTKHRAQFVAEERRRSAAHGLTVGAHQLVPAPTNVVDLEGSLAASVDQASVGRNAAPSRGVGVDIGMRRKSRVPIGAAASTTAKAIEIRAT